MLPRFLLPALCCPLLSLPTQAEQVLVPRGSKSVWQYMDSGQAPDKAWGQPAFDASRWKSGPAPLGYGEKDMATTVSFGANARAKPLTTWFRRTVEVAEPAKVASLLIQLRRDDGAIIYWNGREIARSNMPAGPVSPDTAAATALRDDVEHLFHRYVVPAKDVVQKGTNVIAVEVHQCEPGSSDLIFDLEATAYAPGETPPGEDLSTALPAALRSGDRSRAAALLLKLDPASDGYAETIVSARRYFTREDGAPDENYFKLIDKAYAALPGDMDIVYAWIRARVDARRDLPVKPAARPLPSAIPDEFRFIGDTPEGPARGRPVPRAKLLADIDDLELILENCYAYLDRRGANYRGALDALRTSLTEDLPLSTFHYRVSRMLTVFGDPHSRLSNPGIPEPRLPVLFAMDGEKLAALDPRRSGLLENGFPYVTAINGKPAADWITAAGHLVPQASTRSRLRMSLDQLPALSAVARELKVSPEPVTFTLSSPDGKESKTRSLTLSLRGSSRGGPWPETESEVRKDGIGYLRISQMEDGVEFIESVNGWMEKFKDTRGLIIDVRGNGGGTQDAIKTLLPWLMKPGSPMKIINVAAYRLPVRLPHPNPSGFLGLYGRGLHPATSSVWTPEQTTQIRTFLGAWQPKWKLPEGKFSDWHVMAVSRDSNPEAEYYSKPVIVLQDEGCFSATDNFLGALKGQPGVTLMGTTSGGGSGRMASYTLPNSRLSLTLCQMASFATTGLTYDGNGVPPDVVLAPKLDDLIRGKGDSVLDAAVQRLGK